MSKPLLTLPRELLEHPGRVAYGALSDKEKLAVDLFVVTKNGSKSFKAAGYHPRTKDHDTHGAAWFKRDKIAPAVEWLNSVRSWASGIATVNEIAGEDGIGGLIERTLAEVKLLAFSDIGHYKITDGGKLDVAEGAPEGAMRAVQSFKWKLRYEKDRDGEPSPVYEGEVRMWSKPDALRFLGDFLGMLGTKQPAVPADGTGEAGAVFEVIVQGADGSRTEVRGGARAKTEGKYANPD